jgi:Zn-dependent protease
MLLAAVAIRMGIAAGYFRVPEAIHGYSGLVSPANSSEPTFFTAALSILFLLNLLLGTFNLLPVPPLDGHSGIMVLMPASVAVRYLGWLERARGFSMLGLIIAWTLYDRLFGPIFVFALHTLYAGIR